MDVLEVEVEDVGATSLVSNLRTTLGTQHGVAYHRFVGRARSTDAGWPTFTVVGGAFPLMRAPLDDLRAHGAWVDAIQEQLGELRRRLAEEGWRPAGMGARTGGPTATPALASTWIRQRTPSTTSSEPATHTRAEPAPGVRVGLRAAPGR
jgi:hypothetical protein